jgi:hypothetical protein
LFCFCSGRGGILFGGEIEEFFCFFICDDDRESLALSIFKEQLEFPTEGGVTCFGTT